MDYAHVWYTSKNQVIYLKFNVSKQIDQN